MPVRRTLDGLAGDFVRCAAHVPPFSALAVSLHCDLIARRRRFSVASDALRDDRFCEDLYRLLEAWGMNARRAALAPATELFDRARSTERDINALDGLRLETLAAGDRVRISRQLWRLIATLSVSGSGSQLVAGSKFLHHLLPDLVPPMDRAYTGTYFFVESLLERDPTGRIQNNQPLRWQEMFVDFARFANAHAEMLGGLVTGGWQSSIPKVIDNAIVGHVLFARGK